MKNSAVIVIVFAFAMSAFAQNFPKKPEVIPPSEATAPAESNIPVPEQNTEPATRAMKPQTSVKASKEKRQPRRAPKSSTAKKDTAEKK